MLEGLAGANRSLGRSLEPSNASDHAAREPCTGASLCWQMLGRDVAAAVDRQRTAFHFGYSEAMPTNHYGLNKSIDPKRWHQSLGANGSPRRGCEFAV